MRTGRPGETGGTATGDTPDGWEASDRSDRPGKIRLPGDSLLFTAGFLASQGALHIGVLAAVCFAAAVVGDTMGYAIGHRVGRHLYARPDSRLFRRKHLRRAEAFFARHGGKAVVLARFIPVVRTFTPVVAGAGAMPYRQFVGYNVLGGLLWAVGVALAGYFLGSAIPGVDRYLLPIIAAIVVLSVLPALWHWWRERGAASPLAREGGRDAGGE